MDNKHNDELLHYHTLLQRVFNTEDGRALLKLLIKRYQTGKLFSTDPLDMAKNASRHDLIEELKSGVLVDLDVFSESQQSKLYNPLNRS